MQKSQIQFLQPTTHLYWNEKLDSTLMEILKRNWHSQLQYVVSLFNIFCNTNITLKNFKSYSIFTQKMRSNFPINHEILSTLFV